MLRKSSIAYKYLTAFILIIVLPILAISFLLNRFYLNTLQKNASDRILQAMQQIAIGMNDEGKRTSLLAAMISSDDEIIDLTTKWRRTGDPSRKYSIARQIDTKLDFISNYNNDIQSIILFFHNQGSYFYKNSAAIDEMDIRKMAGFREAGRRKGRVVLADSLGSFVYNAKDYLLAGWVAPDVPSFRSDVAVIYFAFHSNVLNELYSGVTSERIGEMLVVDKTGRIIAANNRKLIGSNLQSLKYFKKTLPTRNQSFTLDRSGQKFLVTTYAVQKTDWLLVNLVDYRILTNNIEKVWRYVIIILGLFILLFLAFTLFFFRDIILPVNNLIKQMKLVERGNFDVGIRVKRNDEIYQLGQSFNKMVAEIKKLMQERDNKEKARSKAELEALKSQINPHFIANTLNSIRLMAMIAKVDSIKNMCEAFMKLLAASFCRDEALTTVEQEIANLQNYIYIMKVRYGDKFDICFDVNGEILNTYILKMVLQPIIENAILHGIRELEGKGAIQIRGCRAEDDLRFEIRDNGVGMTPDQIQQLLIGGNSNQKGFSSIGIKNVDRRIKLNYGDRYGLLIKSVPGEFTQVEILLPLILPAGKEERSDVQTDCRG